MFIVQPYFEITVCTAVLKKKEKINSERQYILYVLYTEVHEDGVKEEFPFRGAEPGTCLSGWVALKTQSMNKSTQFDPFKYQMELYSPLGNNRHAWTHSLISMREAECDWYTMWLWESSHYVAVLKVLLAWFHCLWLWVKWAETVAWGGW